LQCYVAPLHIDGVSVYIYMRLIIYVGVVFV